MNLRVFYLTRRGISDGYLKSISQCIVIKFLLTAFSCHGEIILLYVPDVVDVRGRLLF